MYQIYLILEWHSTCFGRSLCPSSGVQGCAYGSRHLSNRYCCLLASKQTAVYSSIRLTNACCCMYSLELLMMDADSSICLLASRQHCFTNTCCCMYSFELLMMEEGPSETCSVIPKWNKFDTSMHLVGFTIEIILRCTALCTSDLLRIAHDLFATVKNVVTALKLFCLNCEKS